MITNRVACRNVLRAKWLKHSAKKWRYWTIVAIPRKLVALFLIYPLKPTYIIQLNSYLFTTVWNGMIMPDTVGFQKNENIWKQTIWSVVKQTNNQHGKLTTEIDTWILDCLFDMVSHVCTITHVVYHLSNSKWQPTQLGTSMGLHG